MLQIYIARHGQNKDNADGILNGHRDLPLTEIGKRQAKELAAGIKGAGLTFDKVYASPLCRAYNTAEAVTDELRLPKPEILPDLIERDFGIMTGKPVSEIEPLCGPDIVKTATITYFLSPEGAETFPVLLERAKRVLATIRERHSDGSVLLVTHGDIGKMLYVTFYGLDWRECLELFHFGNSELLLLSEDSKFEDRHVIRIEQYNH